MIFSYDPSEPDRSGKKSETLLRGLENGATKTVHSAAGSSKNLAELRGLCNVTHLLSAMLIAQQMLSGLLKRQTMPRGSHLSSFL